MPPSLEGPRRGQPRRNQTGPENASNAPPTQPIDPNITATIHQIMSEMLPSLVAQTVEALRQSDDGEDPNLVNQPSETQGQGTDTGGNSQEIHLWLERFHKQKPRVFILAATPVDAEDWIIHLEKIFRVLGCPDHIRVELAIYKLEGDAYCWWHVWKQAHTGVVDIGSLTWEEFKELFYQQYFSNSDKDAYGREYATIRQRDDESISDYMARFLRLASYAGIIAGIASYQTEKFKWSLNGKYRSKLINQNFTTVAQVVDAARNIERERLDTIQFKGDKDKKRKHDGSSGSFNRFKSDNSDKRRFGGSKFSGSSQSITSSNPSVTTPPIVCKECNLPHRPSPCLRMTGSCFNCGQRGHLANWIKSKLDKACPDYS
ncbi:uncharacterized protein LOC112506183 [Cynara cardunculus var. scolymus]|uniref:uncharacterized protein LOC112506183 n=1 Tax=Cynara cardunculus var. scolymus TaxID=59895 RepID=UPI000D625EE7|nr:uncharacterized protein LOC112506183 [Cynara cardunculus var. scolymus]